MAIVRMDNVGVVVEDLDAAVDFFVELGMELEGRADIDGEWAGHVVGLADMRSEIAMLRTPDGLHKIELATYRNPVAIRTVPQVLPPNTAGLHRMMFAVDDIRETVKRLEVLGAEVLDEIVNYEGVYLLCYLRGPEGIIVALAEQLT